MNGRSHIEYEDFVVHIGPGRDGQLAVRVLESPAGEGEGVLGLPESPADWPQLRPPLGDLGARSAGPLHPAGADPRAVGEALFRAVFRGQVGKLFARSLGAAGERGLRIRLRFRLESQDPRLAALLGLPWELLRQPDTRDFLCLSRRTPIVRSLEVPRPAPLLPFPSPLRILVVHAEAPGLPALDLADERRAIREAWGGTAGAEIEFLERGGLAELRKALLATPFHVLHFMGHGELSRPAGEGILYFPESDGWRPISGESLAVVLKDFPSLRLVFLNACESGRTPAGTGLDLYAGVAAALVLGGLPTVLAMQLDVDDAAAVAFSRTVYLRLAAGDPIDAAVTEGRLAVHALRPTTAEWAIPVLFTRAVPVRLAEQPAAADPFVPSPEPQEPRKMPVTVPLPPTSRWRNRRTAILFGLLALAAGAAWTGDHLVSWLRAPSVPALYRVRVGEFWIGRFEVSNEDFAHFVRAHPEWQKSRADPAFHDGEYLKSWPSETAYPAGLADHPVTQVPWYAAQAFCTWAGGSLPTREQWQAAAHTAEHRFPWRETDPSGSAPLNFCDADCPHQQRDATFLPRFRDGYSATAPVHAFPGGRSREGAYNLSGNVWEWCLDASGEDRVTMGGSYLMMFEECSTDEPGLQQARLCAADVGFRCAWVG
ncbi:MAG TPA: SUMF1/EgtB/PvdO family nonheme iron enzyme [Thermoanaerobaculia bacterium]|nr:SUMF1/EgtB/PvdO family nonheme iron enzyme [Thermoanaerobaculia bacterium]